MGPEVMLVLLKFCPATNHSITGKGGGGIGWM